MKTLYIIKYIDIFGNHGTLSKQKTTSAKPLFGEYKNKAEAINDAMKFKYKLYAKFALWLVKRILKNEKNIMKVYISKIYI